MQVIPQILKRHPFSNRRELNTRAARERDAWIETANMHCKNEFFWRDRCKQRCAIDGHTFVVTGDESGLYCTCCGATEPRAA